MSVGTPEIIVILLVALLVFGPHRLPEVGRQVGAAMREMRRIQDTVRGELDMVLHPEHGTSSSDVPNEPGDHGDYSDDVTSSDITSTPYQPDSYTETTPEISMPPEFDAATEEDRRFLGPPDSFI
jgi:TatA/E family protein of Tat protein translocase